MQVSTNKQLSCFFATSMKKVVDFSANECRMGTVVIDMEIEMITILAVVLSSFLVLVLVGGAVSGSVKTLG